MTSVFDDSGVSWPALLLKQEALQHNAERMARFCAERGISIAPHGKTAVSPELWKLQEGAGAWAVAVATPQQARVFRGAGAQRIFLANQVVDAGFLRWIQSELAADRSFEFLCNVDSVAGVSLIDAALDPELPAINVLIEVGHQGGRAGCRTAASIDAVATAVEHSPVIRLVGVAGYEGTVSHDRDNSALAAVTGYLSNVLAQFQRLAQSEMLSPDVDEYILSAGGSLYFDLVADVFAPVREALGRPVRTVIRSGAYITHDHGLYQRMSPLGSSPDGGFWAASEVWAQVISIPEPGFFLLNAGRRDVPFDQGLPTVLGRRHDGALVPVPSADLFELNDHHAFVRCEVGAEPCLGELVLLGTSHPCTLHDKWPRVIVVDADYSPVGEIRSYF